MYQWAAINKGEHWHYYGAVVTCTSVAGAQVLVEAVS